jgi:hypothetical protein
MQQRVAAAVAEPALRFARRMNLARCEPHSELSSTSYTLANPGEEYLVLQPSDTADPFTVSVTPGTYSVEWFCVNERRTVLAGVATITGPAGFTPPFDPAGPAALYLKTTS